MTAKKSSTTKRTINTSIKFPIIAKRELRFTLEKEDNVLFLSVYDPAQEDFFDLLSINEDGQVFFDSDKSLPCLGLRVGV